MNYSHFYRNLEALGLKMFPSLQALEVSWPYLISPLEMKLPSSIREKAKRAIQAFDRVAHTASYQSLLEPIPGISDHPPKNHSVLMAYDFHTTENGDCYLIEINTNASGFLIASLMEMTHNEISFENYEPLQRLRASFESEWAKETPPQVAITDQDIPSQRMLLEFHMYRDWFKSFGWESVLIESRDFQFRDDKLFTPGGKAVDLVYNRLTDFYLSESEHQALRKAYQSPDICVTPNPFEYWLLADKQRLVQFGDDEFLRRAGASEEDQEAIRQVLLPTYNLGHFGSTDEIWEQRKNLFFKPRRSYGGKSVYRGETVSRRVFERLISEDVLVQKFQPAQKMPVDDPRSVLSHWKFDLRFFVYRSEIQLVAARIYQGQVTNFSSPMGGFTLVRF